MVAEVDQNRLNGELEALAKFTSDPSSAVTRIVFSKEDLDARNFLIGLFEEAGLEVRIDAVGNTFARWTGSDVRLAPVATGSHIDAIPNAGMYDGTVGVLGGLEAIRSLRRSGFQPQRSIELILFTSEEPTRFGIGCLGSRLMSGALEPKGAAALQDDNEETLDDVRLAAGFCGDLSSVPIQRGSYSHFVELHIEQGPILEREGVKVGLVEAIAAPASGWITVTGDGGHAGGVMMKERRDALVLASKIIQMCSEAASLLDPGNTVATVGICEVFPGAVNSVPSRVRMSLDVRDVDLLRRNRCLETIQSACEHMNTRDGYTVVFQLVNQDDPATCSPDVLSAAEAACKDIATAARRMPSRAYHDALFMARICPTAMIFVPCRGGVSHRPDEYASPEDIEAGVAVLAGTLSRLAD